VVVFVQQLFKLQLQQPQQLVFLIFEQLFGSCVIKAE